MQVPQACSPNLSGEPSQPGVPPPKRDDNLLRRVDPRLKLLLAAGFGLELWYGGVAALACIGALVLLAQLVLVSHDRAHLRILMAGGVFVLFWTLAAWGLGLWEGAPPLPALQRSLLLGARLLLLLLLGLALAMSGSARQLGLGLSWLLRPLLGKRAWQLALALSLMVHFLPRSLETLLAVRRMDRLRAPRRGPWLRWGLMAQATLRILAQNAWKQTVALAARGLDAPEAWQADFPARPASWLVGGVLLLLGAGAAAL